MKAFLRFLYLNTYGFVLAILGLILFSIPTLQLSVLLFVVKCLIVLFLEYKGIFIFSQWEEKKKHYQQLMSINQKRIKGESFESFIRTPCGRLLTKAVLRDLGKTEYYPVLKKTYVLSFRESIWQMRHPKPSEIVFSEAAMNMLKNESK